LADPIRVHLKTNPQHWVEIKARWTYADKAAVMESNEPTGVAMLHTVVVARNFDAPKDLAELDDDDGQVIIDAIVKARQAQMGDLLDPNS